MALNNDSYAALDLGSNSFHLLIARFHEDKLRVIDRHKDMVRLAAGLDNDGRLSDDAQERALASLAKMADRLRSVPPRQIRIVGTNTLRAATNANDFMAKAEAVLGLPINIISGTEEARLVYLGVANDFAPEKQRRLVIDIGGGSTELVIGTNAPRQLESLPMGCVSFSMRYFADGNICDKAFKKAVNAARQMLSPYVEPFRAQWDEAVGSSGTIRSIGKILAEQQLSEAGYISADGLEKLKNQVLAIENNQNLNIPGLSDDRKEVFIGGLAVLYAIFQELDMQGLHVSAYAIREGIVHDLAGRLHHRDKREDTIKQLIIQYGIDSAQGDHVAELCTRLLPAVSAHLNTPESEAEALLRWAAQLHELGLAIAHGGYHKHGAYILGNADMPGFSRQEQARLSFLVANHRRKPKQPSTVTYGVTADWPLVCVLRLSCILYRRRQPKALPESITLENPSADELILSIPEDWLSINPLITADLEDEAELLKKSLGIKLRLESKSG
ncbi:Exopolyphosphatase [Zhongshania aliphaticivorans]|uniref:Exopolyphosphatase n=1 Tax=Zhongshania aliphaticivorans TaxID=1470434 RepID=A0A5S9MXF3_9GAMM|nr:exopolyphosphatase [Zhongshania aliphaticivorans]CAA0081409.1 Exopolyphosphatase [Zhongshania aliphaticivorans]CAA0085041.1 Exopolyphosphatase [Zhongshania aliphaticivorans]